MEQSPKQSPAAVFPLRLTLRDTKVFTDEGQRIFTTATGYGYEKCEYVRADLASTIAPAAVEPVTDLISRLSAKLEEAKAIIKDLEAHEGAEGFSVSTHAALEKFWKENQ